MTEADLADPDLRSRAVQAALGRRPFDLLICGGQVLDVLTGQLRTADVGLAGPLIASVHEPDAGTEALAVHAADGLTVVPGLIDTHMHVESSMVTPASYAAAVVPRGCTTAVWDPHEYANVAGLDGVRYALDAARAAALRLLVLAPSCVPSAPGFERSGADFDADTLAGLLAQPDIHGVAEMMTMHALLAGDQRPAGIVAAGLASDKRVCGHARGLAGKELAAYAAAGVATDHEITSAADLREKIAAGLTIELRGSHDHLLPEFAQALLELGELPQTITLCTDDTFPDDLAAHGGVDQVVRRLIALGLPAGWAYRAATFNAATRIGRPDLGLVAPGRRADLALVADLDSASVADVIMDGRLVARNGAMLEDANADKIPAALQRTMRVAPVSKADFEIKAQGSKAEIATIECPRFTKWGQRQVDIKDGCVVLPPDATLMAVVNRHGAKTPVRLAVLEGWGSWRGAFATTVSHDSHNLTVFGHDPADLAAAAAQVCAMQGGLAVAVDGEVVASLALPVAGLTSAEPLAEVAAGFIAVREAMDRVVDWEPPLLVFKACFGASLVCNPGPRLSDVGIVSSFEDIVRETPVLSESTDENSNLN